ncbi:hypothetical protein FA95DRAFT_1489947 [Auriscalpium vulgare]|uniref:Uncharacterized protein n=1 Tax=Auriscalpium vulgare TaxID=40419 RepID=A0ACB8RYU7_9AGAM|nr:hypothetical protein FA95DRAFT_1489947 [Auriscalpium vulgare]
MLPRRHPRYAILLGVLFFITLILLLPTSPLISAPAVHPNLVHHPRPPADLHALPARVQKAERIYQRMLRLRRRLITKYGPKPEDIVLFPPDRDPWPPYTVWDFFPPAFNCPHDIERVGTLGDGGKWVCGLERLRDKQDCVVYSVGSPADASFEAELLARTKHCQLYLYDPSSSSPPRGPWDSRGRVHFHRWGVAGFDAHASSDKNKFYTLQSLMRANGHAHVDLLKIDLEGWEFDAMTAFVNSLANPDAPPADADFPPASMPVGQMLLELHLWNRRFVDVLKWWTALEDAGLRAVSREPNLVYQNYNKEQGAELAEYTFLNVRTRNIFTSEPAAVPPSTDRVDDVTPPVHVNEDDAPAGVELL